MPEAHLEAATDHDLFNTTNWVLWQSLNNYTNNQVFSALFGAWNHVELNKIDFPLDKVSYLIQPFAEFGGKSKVLVFSGLLRVLNKKSYKNYIIDSDLDLLIHRGKVAYCQLVSAGIEAIRQNEFSKLVCSHAIKIPFKNLNRSQIDPIIRDLFVVLTKVYPTAYVSAAKIDQDEYWITASPELLLERTGKVLKTVALAGTQKADPKITTDQYQWGIKETSEQEHVTRYISEILEQKGRTFSLSDTYTVLAGPVAHIRTDITIEAHQQLQQDIDLAVSLHPTSAVCGSPLLKARNWLLAHEGYDRALYAGFAGPVYPDGDFRFAVNLRTVKISQEDVTVYVGAGITSESQPELEWIETLNKAKTLIDPLASVFAANGLELDFTAV